jgi:hypothetical protein
LFHPVGVAVGADDVAVEQADGGGVLGQEPAPGFERPVRADAQGAAFIGGDEPESSRPGVSSASTARSLIATDNIDDRIHRRVR